MSPQENINFHCWITTDSDEWFGPALVSGIFESTYFTIFLKYFGICWLLNPKLFNHPPSLFSSWITSREGNSHKKGVFKRKYRMVNKTPVKITTPVWITFNYDKPINNRDLLKFVALNNPELILRLHKQQMSVHKSNVNILLLFFQSCFRLTKFAFVRRIFGGLILF